MNKNTLSLTLISLGSLVAGIVLFDLSTFVSKAETSEAAPVTEITKPRLSLEAIPLTDLDGNQKLIANWHQPVLVVNFWAPWCGPCKMIGPTFEKLSKEDANVGIKFIKVDVDDAEDVAEKCGVTAMPTFQVWRGGNKVSSLVGASKDKLAALIAKFA